MKKKLAPLVNDRPIKDSFVYIRVDEELSKKIVSVQKKNKFKNRSQAIRAILQWSFQNGVDQTG